MKKQRIEFLYKDKDAFGLSIETNPISVRQKTQKEGLDNHVKFANLKTRPSMHG